ncbi:glycosyltransferase family 39 protein [Candidatus Peregrinibacteria bacterium]|nr:glycosyltransferase family 39 protein [Candidatus Peregrinibacteria bacterium]MBI3816613.1 glycosyltransferase family 39 protein [Candidatus Peregrinibacteria bacterium]
MRRTTLVLLGILLLGFLVRVQAVRWNWFMHSDVVGDASVAASVHRDGHFLVFPRLETVDPSAYTLPPPSQGELLKLHGPLLPFLGAGLIVLWGGGSTFADGFLALRILTLLGGTLVILLSFLVASRLLDRTAGLAAAAWTAASFVLIDYSGNGALYTLQGVVYLLWLLVALSSPSLRCTLLLGVLAGLGYLITFQCILLLPAGLFVLAMDVRPGKRFLLHAAAFAGVAILIASLWLIRNAVLFGDPLQGHAANMRYVYSKAGIDVPPDILPSISLREKLSLFAGVVGVWLPDNLYYAARKFFILAPIAFFLFCYGLIDIVFSRERLRRMFPILALITLQILLDAAWPVWKFRFFVPLIPPVFLIALEELWHLPITARWRQAFVGVTFAAIIAVSVLTYRATPTHTTYYDGALTQDPFHGSEEMDYLRTFHLLSPSYAH